MARRRVRSNPTREALSRLKDIQRLILSRERTYGCTWYLYGYKGNAAHLKEKALRFLHQLKKKLPPEVSYDTLQDLIVWATFCMVCINLPTKFDPERYKLRFTKKQLYGSTEELTAEEQFVLSSKFYNAMWQAYIKNKPITEAMVDDLLDSVLRMKFKVMGCSHEGT